MSLLLILLVVLVLLLVAIVWLQVHPFLALLGVSLLYGIAAGQAPREAADAFLDGFGSTMRWIGVVIVLGTLIGELLSETGGTRRIADTVLRAVGSRRLPLAMALTGYIVAIPAFVDVAYIMLKPIVEVLAVRSGRRVLVVGLSLAAGLTATHALLPPTPGPLAAAGIVGAELGRVVLINMVVAAAAAGGGLLWACTYCQRVMVPADEASIHSTEGSPAEMEQPARRRRRATVAFLPILLPLGLIAAGAFVGQSGGGWACAVLRLLGAPMVALLLGVLVALPLVERHGFWQKFNGLVERSIHRSAVVLMITGAGGGFGGVIKSSGVGDAIAAAFAHTHLPPLLLPFLLAMALTTATGSLTVSMVTTSSVVAAMLEGSGMSAEMAVALIGAGSLCVIHANSSFFWLLSKLHDVRPDALYRTYCVQSLCMGAGGLAGALLLWLLGVR